MVITYVRILRDDMNQNLRLIPYSERMVMYYVRNSTVNVWIKQRAVSEGKQKEYSKIVKSDEAPTLAENSRPVKKVMVVTKPHYITSRLIARTIVTRKRSSCDQWK